MTSSQSTSHADLEKTPPEACVQKAALDDPDAEFGGHEARQRLERKLVRKIDVRMSILTVIYILNYVRLPWLKMSSSSHFRCAYRLIVTMLRTTHTVSLSRLANFCGRAARARGLETDLDLHDQEFPTLLSILYAGYIFMQIPS